MSPEAFRTRLRDGPCLLLDGAMGSRLLACGLAPGRPAEIWNHEHPERVRAVHDAYVAAGSEAVHTNTFGCHPLRLEAFGLEARCAELAAAAVRLARGSGARFVIGDLGPAAAPGAPADVQPGYELQIAALAAAEVDALHAETLSDLRQALAVVRAARQQAPGLALIVSMTFERKAAGFFTLAGQTVPECFAALQDAGVDAVGANCWLTAVNMAALARAALDTGGLRLVLQPCAGEAELIDGGRTCAERPSSFARSLEALLPRLAAVGGCCGTDPAFIGALAPLLA